MKFTTLTLTGLAFVAVGEAAHVRRTLKIENSADHDGPLMHQAVTSAQSKTMASPVAPKTHRVLQQSANMCTNYAVVGDFITSYCTPDASCECPEDYSVKEDITGDGCFHCSKPNGATCTDSHECLTNNASECINGTCTPLQCPNTATFNGSYTRSMCSYSQDCECSASSEYSVKENLQDMDCFHCAKPDGAQCQEDHECTASSSCNNGICGTAQCPHTATVDSLGRTTSQCAYSADCECSAGEYTLKEDLNGNGCFHCAKPNGAECSTNDECMSGAKCNDGICGAQRCPLISEGRCTLSDSCACEGDFPFVYTHTFPNGTKCYGCASIPSPEA